MNIYFDTEFTSLKKDADLISIGLVSDEGDAFYAEFNDFNVNKISNNIVGNDHFIEVNVFPNLCFNKYHTYYNQLQTRTKNYAVFMKDNRKNITMQLIEFLKDKDILLISDVCHFDFVLFIDLFGSALDLPENICPYCHDINVDIATYQDISEKEAFDFSRTDLANYFTDDIIDPCMSLFKELYHKDKHNALYDAFEIAKIYRAINSI